MSRVVCSNREGSLKKQRKQHAEENIAFCNAIYHPALSKSKKILMGKWHLIQNYIGKKNHQNVSWSELIYEDRSIKSLAEARSVRQAHQYFKF